MPGPDKSWGDHIAAEVQRRMAEGTEASTGAEPKAGTSPHSGEESSQAPPPFQGEGWGEVPKDSTEKVWPPAPAPTAQAGAKFCPSCGRKLLTQTSALCNWCGKKIDDADYQQRALQERLERDAMDRQAVEASIQQEAEYGTLGSLKRRAKERKGVDLKP